MFKIDKFSGSYFKGVVLVVLVLGIIFRLGNLNLKPYWEDEIYTSMRVSGYELVMIQEAVSSKLIQVKTLFQYQDVSSGQTWIDTSIALAKKTEHTPLYYLLARAWAKLFGSSVVSMRAFPALISLLTLPLFYWLTFLLFKSSAIASTTLCLACVSPILIRYAQEARPYSLWMVWILLSSILLLRALRFNTKHNWIFYGVTISLAFLTHLLSSLIFIVHSLYVLIIFGLQPLVSKANSSQDSLNSPSSKNIVNQQKIKHFFIAFGIGLLPLLPWFGLLIYNYSSVQAATGWLTREESLRELVFKWLRNISYIIFSRFQSQDHNYLFLVIILSILLAVSTFKMISKSYLRSWLMPILLCIIPSSILIASDLFWGGRRSTIIRYLIPTYIGSLLTLGFGLSFNYLELQNSLKNSAWIKSVIFHAILVIAISASWFNLQSPTWWGKPDLQMEAAEAITHVSSKTVVLSDQRLAKFMSFAFLLRPTDYLLWFKPNQNPDLEYIFENSKTVFLFEPSKRLFDKVNNTAAQMQYMVEPFYGDDVFQIKPYTE